MTQNFINYDIEVTPSVLSITHAIVTEDNKYVFYCEL